MRRLVPDPGPTTVAEQIGGLDLVGLAGAERPYLVTNFALTLDGAGDDRRAVRGDRLRRRHRDAGRAADPRRRGDDRRRDDARRALRAGGRRSGEARAPPRRGAVGRPADGGRLRPARPAMGRPAVHRGPRRGGDLHGLGGRPAGDRDADATSSARPRGSTWRRS